MIFLTANKEIKVRAKARGVLLWEIADKLDLTDSNFSRKLRREFSDAEKQHIFVLIDQIAAEKEKAI